MTRIFLTLILTLLPQFESGAPREPWTWPTVGPTPVVRAFDPPFNPWLAGHRGVDLDVPLGTTITSPADGKVVYAGKLVDRGVISIRHAGGIRSTFEPVDVLVSTGDFVARGQAVAVVVEGHAPGSLHWGAKISSDEYVDPLRFVRGKIVLKPWD